MLRPLFAAPASVLAVMLAAGNLAAAAPITCPPPVTATCPVWTAIGSGTGNGAELQSKITNLSGCYYLTKDIDAGDTRTNTFVAIGRDGSPFNGTFDGCGHAIKNLTINSSGPSAATRGLFGFVSTSGAIRNVGLTNATITGGATQQYVGALAG